MTITVPVAIADPSLPLPDPADRATFTARKLEHLRWEKEVLSPGALALGTASYNNALDAQGSATSAAANAVAVAANTALAAGYAGATIWVSGTSYIVGDVRYSPINQRSYRRIIAGGGTTDPSADATNWQLVDINRPIIQVNASTYTAVAGFHYEIIYAGVCTLSLPATPGSGNAVEVTVSNAYDNILARNGSTIEALSEDMALDVHHLVAKYSTSTWRVSP